MVGVAACASHEPPRTEDTGQVRSRLESTLVWRMRSAGAPVRRTSHALAIHPVSDALLLIGGSPGGGEMWSWDGAVWARVESGAPVPAKDVAVATDTSRRKLVLFGGTRSDATNAPVFGKTWEWDGASWTEVAVGGPTARRGAAMAYDAARRRVVLFGGSSKNSGPFQDTWEYDGASWVERTTAPEDSPPRAGSMVYDASGKRVLQLVAAPAQGEGLETWAWNGEAWSNLETPLPSGNFAGALAFDTKRARVVAFVKTGTVWELGASGWSEAPASGGPGPRGEAEVIYAPKVDRTIVLGGTHLKEMAVWGWNGTNWTSVAPNAPDWHDGRLAFDSRRNVTVFLPSGRAASPDPSLPHRTWEWDGVAWKHLTSAAAPPVCSNAAMVFDPSRGRTVHVECSETWEWDGSSWAKRVTASAPPSSITAASYDSDRKVVVLIAGSDAPSSGATYEYDGDDWKVVVAPEAGPPADRHRAALSYDPVRKRSVLVGGHTGDGVAHEDLWEYDGAQHTWTEGTVAPPPVAMPALTFDLARGVSVLEGGLGAAHGTWDFDGVTWEPAPVAESPPPRHRPLMAYDSKRSRAVYFGGSLDGLEMVTFTAETWELFETRVGSPCAVADECGSGYCVDGVCCNGACGGGAADSCQACSVAAGAAVDGICVPVPRDGCSLDAGIDAADLFPPGMEGGESSSGCGCRVTQTRAASPLLFAVAALAALTARRRRGGVTEARAKAPHRGSPGARSAPRCQDRSGMR
jgi:MYXO-CTERM domain-containing protein